MGGSQPCHATNGSALVRSDVMVQADAHGAHQGVESEDLPAVGWVSPGIHHGELATMVENSLGKRLTEL